MRDPKREELEQLWRSRVKDAQLRLDFARNYLAEVQRDFPPGDVPSPDGSFALQKALRAENFALAEYHRVLRMFTDLVLHGTIPDDKEWRNVAIADDGGDSH